MPALVSMSDSMYAPGTLDLVQELHILISHGFMRAPGNKQEADLPVERAAVLKSIRNIKWRKTTENVSESL